MLVTQSQIFTFATGRFYDKPQVLEFAFVEQHSEEAFTFYVNDDSRGMFFAVSVKLEDAESETEESLGRKLLKAYDHYEYVSTGLELEIKGKEIFQALKVA
ncbi:hypothetical protein OTK49_21565 [Vibrio coralliirubri]|uniref:hypothetical protein n=1 Tax=Vibrio coralliirubri TaxID=1516159 RepID=UPI00228400AA|nr:hypothetical protein [Vibrio coralliirubri]MCY9865111.1 hypothetical protein [Vibrio coralliirubri]